MSHIPEEPQEKDELESLVLPRMNLAGLVRHFGPGLILMMTGI